MNIAQSIELYIAGILTMMLINVIVSRRYDGMKVGDFMVVLGLSVIWPIGSIIELIVCAVDHQSKQIILSNRDLRRKRGFDT